MRRLDGKNFEERHACIAPLIRLGDSITALCVGDGYLFQHYFVKQANEYIGLDINQHFIAHAENNLKKIPSPHLCGNSATTKCMRAAKEKN